MKGVKRIGRSKSQTSARPSEEEGCGAWRWNLAALPRDSNNPGRDVVVKTLESSSKNDKLSGITERLPK